MPTAENPSRIRLCALLTLSLTAILATAAESPEPEVTDRGRAEQQLADVLKQIDALKDRLEAARGEHRREQERLRKADLELQQANRELRSLQEQAGERQHELDHLERERGNYLDKLAGRMGELAEQLRWAYRADRQSRIRLLLNQDDPATMSRMMAYYDYFVRAQADRIALLHETLAKLETMQQSIDAEIARIARLTDQQKELLERLDARRAERAVALARLDDEIGDESSRLQELERNRRDLEALIERLADVLADIPADLGEHLSFGRQKGRLPMPVSGPVQHAFGQARGAGLNWQGWLIGAEPGTEVTAIAYGRVAFADWLRGYGLLMIIDHGDGFMSLYGNNESLLAEVGAWVEPGAVISIVGANPGTGQGLYFELRRNGKAVDPSTWIAR